MEMTCTNHCSYFPNVETTDWVYDEKTGLKVRKHPREFICGYDGHVITSWYDECPKNLEKETKKNG